jgi:predicted nucleotidyltransferase component of viral defense system
VPIKRLHRKIASTVLKATHGQGFALAGGNALIAHGIGSRPTSDVDLFTSTPGAVEAAADDVQDALRRAGFRVQPRDKTGGGLADIFPGMGEGLAEYVVSESTLAGPGSAVMLQMSFFDRALPAVEIAGVGPVLDVEDVLGGKVAALAARSEPRDYIDTAAALAHYRADILIRWARRLDPGLAAREFTDAAARLDRMPDALFAQYDLCAQDIAVLRKRFADWPR